MELYNLYFKSNAKHRVNVSPELASEIYFSKFYFYKIEKSIYNIYFSVLNGPMSNVVQLRTTPQLFQAYEEVYSSLESKYCPAFFKSEEVRKNKKYL